jgi:hypothetical protein
MVRLVLGRCRRTLIAAGAVALLAGISTAPDAVGQDAGCPPPPTHLSPKGNPGSRFTMLIRVNKPKTVNEYAAMQAATGQLRTRDIFVVNTRFPGSTPEEAEQIVDRLGVAFPCNRVIALNGLGADPSRPGYAFSLVHQPGLWAVMLDWERRDWARARATDPSMSRWKRRFGRSLNRLHTRLAILADNLDAAGSGIGRVGAVPSFFHDWNYGRVARAVDHHNRRFGNRRGGVQAVATQAACKKQRGGDREDREKARMKAVAKKIFRQYGKKRRKKRNLALQVSFSDHARAKRYLPIRSVNEGRAAKCIRRGLRAGGGAFLLWASPYSMADLFETRRFRKLRPPQG